MVKVIFLILVIFCCNSCIKTVHVCGHIFKEEEIRNLEKARSKEDIENLLGSPTTISDFGQETWYYITTKKETIAFLPDTILEQNIVAISFNKDKIDKITKYTERDSKKLPPISEYTATKGNDITTTQQFFGNVGKFNSNKPPEPAKPRSGF